MKQQCSRVKQELVILTDPKAAAPLMQHPLGIVGQRGKLVVDQVQGAGHCNIQLRIELLEERHEEELGE